MRREGRCDAARQVSDTGEVQFALSPLFLHQIKWRTTSHACKYTTAGSFRAFHMSPLSAHFRSHTQTTLPGLRRCPGLKSSRLTCNPRGHVTESSHTVFTADTDGAPCCTPWFVYMRLLPERGGCCTPAIPMLLWKQGFCPGQWEGRDYDMCVCAWESINQRFFYLAVCWHAADFNQLTHGGKQAWQ